MSGVREELSFVPVLLLEALLAGCLLYGFALAKLTCPSLGLSMLKKGGELKRILFLSV